MVFLFLRFFRGFLAESFERCYNILENKNILTFRRLVVKNVKDFRELEIGEKIVVSIEEFDGRIYAEGEVIEKYDDHAIVSARGIRWWADQDTIDLFKRIQIEEL